MKTIQLSKFGGPEVLEYKDISEPEPAADEVRVQLHASGINPSEIYIRTGTYSLYTPELPYIPGFDGAGIVEAVGENVRRLKSGDRVFLAALMAKKNTGTYAQKVVCDVNSVHLLPNSFSFQEGAALGIPALTAYRALFHRAKVKAGETVLVHGASGGVGLLTVQMAVGIGATVIGTASTEEGKALVKASGASFVLNHLEEESLKDVFSFTNGKGPDVIIEFLANANLETDMKAIAPFGRIVVVGNRGSIEINPRMAMMKESDILGMTLWNTPEKEYNESLYGITAFLQTGVLQPQIGKEFSLQNAKEAHQYIMNQNAKGKIILTMN